MVFVPRSRHEDSILRSLRRIVRAIDLHSRDLESGFGLTLPQLVCLRVIAASGPMTPSELAREVDLSQATVTGIVDRLARRQYISRRRTSKDRRRVRLAILPAGRDLLEEAPSPLQARFAAELGALPEENQAVIDTMLRQIVRMMGAEGLDAAPLLATGEAGAAPSFHDDNDALDRSDTPTTELRLAVEGGDDE
jgi:DNA-binding MarR family transcriptional regulator